MRRYLFLKVLFAVLLSLPAAAEQIVVDMDFLPNGYSVERVRFAKLLESNPSLVPRNYRRLKFGSRSDEIAYSLKTGNAPDVLSLGIREYRSMAEAGYLMDLSPELLRMPGGPLREVESSWTPLRQSAAEVRKSMIYQGRIYGFPGRRRIHGILLRRGLISDPLPGGPITVERAGQLAAEVSAQSAGPAVAVALDSERLVYWAIAEFVQRMGSVTNGSLETRRGVALSSMDSVCSTFSSILHDDVVKCTECGHTVFANSNTDSSRVCESCGAAGANLVVRRSGVVAVRSAADAVDLFIRGRVNMLICMREDVYPLIDAGLSPDEMLFVPLAGASAVPDMEILCLYSGITGRSLADRRKEELLGLLKEYSSQFLVPPDSPLYLWHEKALISDLARRGYAGLFNDQELAACTEIRPALRIERTVRPNDPAVTVAEYQDLIGMDFTAIDKLVARIVAGRGLSHGVLKSMVRSKTTTAGWLPLKVVLLLCLVAFLAMALRLFSIVRPIVGFRAFVRPVLRPALVLLLPSLLLVLLKFGFAVAGAGIGVAELFKGQGFTYQAVSLALQDAGVCLGYTVFAGLTVSIFSVLLALFVSWLLLRMKEWRVIMGFFVAIPVCLSGFWGLLLLSSVREWLFGGMAAVDAGSGWLALQVVWLAWATMPFASMAYLYRLRRLAPQLYEEVGLEGGAASDGFFAVTWAALEPAVVLHIAVVSIAVAIGSASSLIGNHVPPAGGMLLRTFLFLDKPASELTLNVVTLFAVLAVVLWGFRKIRTVELRKTYSRTGQ